MGIAKMKWPVLWATTFFASIAAMTIGYAGYVSAFPTTATSSAPLSSWEWNKMVTALQTLGGKLSVLDIANDAVGIGGASAAPYKLNVNGSIRTQWGIAWPSAANFHIDSTAGHGLYLNWSSGADVYARNTLLASSDERLKVEIEPIANSLEKISHLKGVTYYWKNPNSSHRKQVGVIAQEVEKQFPELVSTDEEGMMAVNYQWFVAPLIESVKELKDRDEKLSREIDELKKSNAELRELLNAKR